MYHLYIAEKPSVAQEFAKALKEEFRKRDGYMESDKSIVTWCVGHLVTMSYPEVYDPALKRWSLTTIPFLPPVFRYEVIPNVAKQFHIVKGLLNREDVECIYICTDSGREGEYIYRLVDEMAAVPQEKARKRVWIDSQTEEEILRGIREAKDWTAYDNLSSSAYLRAKEDYLMGINFSRVLTLKYGDSVRNFLKQDKSVAISVGRVMTCVLGMLVRREREIRAFVKTPFYRVMAGFSQNENGISFDGEFRAVEGSAYYLSPKLYKENGFLEITDAKKLIADLLSYEPEYATETENNKTSHTAVLKSNATVTGEQENVAGSDESGAGNDTGKATQKAEILSVETKKEKKKPPLLFNLAELQNECSKRFKISPDETLKITQELYEKKLVTYPRTDARVLSTAVAKEITKNLGGLSKLPEYRPLIEEIQQAGSYKGLEKTQYVNDKQITDHYAIIPTGQGLSAKTSLSRLAAGVYDLIVRRFLSIFFPPAVYLKLSLCVRIKEEKFFANFKALQEEGYLRVAQPSRQSGTQAGGDGSASEQGSSQENAENESGEQSLGLEFIDAAKSLKKGMLLDIKAFTIKEGETSPPKRYNSGSLILAMENAGQLIEDEELRAQIKGSGIGTSATRAEILNKLVKISYLNLNKKTQIITPTLLGEMIYDVVDSSIRSLLNAELTASWEKGLTYVVEGSVSEAEYMQKLESFIAKMTNGVKGLNNQGQLYAKYNEAAQYYSNTSGKAK